MESRQVRNMSHLGDQFEQFSTDPLLSGSSHQSLQHNFVKNTDSSLSTHSQHKLYKEQQMVPIQWNSQNNPQTTTSHQTILDENAISQQHSQDEAKYALSHFSRNQYNTLPNPCEALQNTSQTMEHVSNTQPNVNNDNNNNNVDELEQQHQAQVEEQSQNRLSHGKSTQYDDLSLNNDDNSMATGNNTVENSPYFSSTQPSTEMTSEFELVECSHQINQGQNNNHNDNHTRINDINNGIHRGNNDGTYRCQNTLQNQVQNSNLDCQSSKQLNQQQQQQHPCHHHHHHQKQQHILHFLIPSISILPKSKQGTKKTPHPSYKKIFPCAKTHNTIFFY